MIFVKILFFLMYCQKLKNYLTFVFFSALRHRFSPFRSSSFPDEDLEGASQDLPDLISYIKQLHIKPPDLGPYKLHAPNITDFSQNGQSKVIAKIFKNMVWYYPTRNRITYLKYLEASEPKWVDPVLNIIGLTRLDSEASI